MRFVVIDNCPVPARLADQVKTLKADVPQARLNSCYRGQRAAGLLHRLGKKTQTELYAGFVAHRPGFLPANPPGFSSHELRSDGNPVYGARGSRIPWWKVGMDWDDQYIEVLKQAAHRHGWKLVRPYASGSEYHHVSFAEKPKKERKVPYYLRARKAGARYARIIVQEAKREGVPLSLAFAICEQETGFRNVFGHDPTIFMGAGEVTKKKYLAYKAQRGTTRMQGVGPMQLTWWSTQDLADKEGGCWRPRCNIRIGLRTLRQNIASKGIHAGVAAYNGSGAAAERYAASVLEKQARWHRILTGGGR
jgi:hypothetical protein